MSLSKNTKASWVKECEFSGEWIQRKNNMKEQVVVVWAELILSALFPLLEID